MFSCRKMKRVLSHTRQCRMKFHGDCPVCKQLIALCCYHAKLCSEPMCQVPFCPRIKLEKARQGLQASIALSELPGEQ